MGGKKYDKFNLYCLCAVPMFRTLNQEIGLLRVTAKDLPPLALGTSFAKERRISWLL